MDYDVVVIGGGTAGLGAFRKAKSLGKKSLIIEASDFVTTCANVGCMPSKLLIAAAENMHEIKKSSQFGIHVNKVSIDETQLFQRVRNERDRFVGFVRNGAQKINSEDRIIGKSKFINPHTIEVNGNHITAKSFVIATGSRPFVPDMFNGLNILTNENIFELNHIPKKMAIFGAGVIGLELGFAFKNLGTEITLFNKSNNLLRLGQNLNNYLINHIEENFEFIYKEHVFKIEPNSSGVGYKIFYGDNCKEVDQILVTTGRKPNLESLGLEHIGSVSEILNLYNKETTQIGDYPLFLAGDVNNHATILHEASSEGVIAGTNAATYPEIVIHKRNTPLAIVFSSPQIMQVGKTTDLPTNIITGQVSFEDQGRSRVMLRNKGLLQIYFDKNNHMLVGAEMIGPDAEHIAHMLAWLIEKNTTLEEFLSFPFYHPVIEEGIRTALRDAMSKI